MSQYENEPPTGPGNAPPPPNYTGPTATPEAPKPVGQAVILLFVLIALSVINAIVTLTTADTATGASSPLGTVIFVVLYTWLTLSVRGGKNWARITITVLFIIGILFGLVALAATLPALVKLIGVLQLAAQIAILVLLWSRASNEYFAARRPA